MEGSGSCLATASASSIRVTSPSTTVRPRCTSSKSLRRQLRGRGGCITVRVLPINLAVRDDVHVEQIIADRKIYWQNSYGDASSSPPKLPPLVRDLTIDYSALSLVVPEKVRFRVKLEGRDRDWKDAGNE